MSAPNSQRTQVDAILDKWGMTRENWECDPSFVADLMTALDERSGPAERDAVLEAAANAVFIHYQECASDQPAEQYMNGLLNAMQLIRALKNAAPQARTGENPLVGQADRLSNAGSPAESATSCVEKSISASQETDALIDYYAKYNIVGAMAYGGLCSHARQLERERDGYKGQVLARASSGAGNSSDAKDAARYRWIKANETGQWKILGAVDFDAFIDSQMAAPAATEGSGK